MLGTGIDHLRENARPTLTSLSQPHETIRGSLGDGENLTHETQSVCWPSSMVYLQSARVFHRRTVLSREPETICLLSALKATELTSEVCFWKVRTVSPTFKSHRRRVLSQEPDSAKFESLEITTSCTHWECPVSARRAKPTLSASGELFKFHTMIFLSVTANACGRHFPYSCATYLLQANRTAPHPLFHTTISFTRHECTHDPSGTTSLRLRRFPAALTIGSTSELGSRVILFARNENRPQYVQLLDTHLRRKQTKLKKKSRTFRSSVHDAPQEISRGTDHQAYK